MTRIAVLMLIHKAEEQTFRLIKHLSRDFDVYVHIDKKSKLKKEELDIQNVYVYKELKVYWGGYSQILGVHYLLGKAFQNMYDRYLLISGQDLPIKTNQQILDFFSENTAEYISLDGKVPEGSRQKGGLDRVVKYWPNWFHRGNGALHKVAFGILYSLFLLFSKLKPRYAEYEFYKGANWINVTHKCVEKIFLYIKQNPQYLERFKWTNCADELFYQTIVMQLDDLELVNDCLRYIDWNGIEYPKILRKEDYDFFLKSNCLFARKFDSKVDNEIIERIYSFIS